MSTSTHQPQTRGMGQDTCGRVAKPHTLPWSLKRKRKRSANLADARVQKSRPKASHDLISNSSPLIGVLRQYGLLEAVVKNLVAEDLLALACTSRGLHEAIASRPNSLKNLLGRLSCSGKGTQIRNRCHIKSEYFCQEDCTEYVKCGTMDSKRSVETKPCVSCNVATCDECRIHCVYQSIYENSSDPEDPAELPKFSGFVLLEPFEQPILSPYHLPSEDMIKSSHWQNPSTGIGGPYHDQGFLDAPFTVASSAPPERIDDVLDLDLGQKSLISISADSRYGTPSPVTWTLCNAPEQRKMLLCDACFKNQAPKGPMALPPSMPLRWLRKFNGTNTIKSCHCTLRSRFLDRWLCLRCYQTECSTISHWTSATTTDSTTSLCRCGSEAHHILCLWCWGEVTDYEDETSEADADHILITT